MSINESYPPAFRCVTSGGDPQAKAKPVLFQEEDINIPVIDLERLDKKILREACKEWGIFRLKNHGVPLALTSGLQEISDSLLSLPFVKKRELFAAVNSPLSYFWGTPALDQSGDALKRGVQGSNVNMLEGFNVPLSSLSKVSTFTSCDDDDDDAHKPKLEFFRVLLEEYGKHITRIAVSLFEAIAQTLNLELSGDLRSEYLSESTGLIRVYRYPRSPDEALGMEVHTDSSVISILNEDENGGLEIMKGEEWFCVKPVANTLIVNLGDMMQVMSDDEYKSVTHRVKKKNKETERHSMCYFVFPTRDCVIKSSKYKPFTYSEFVAQVQSDVQSLGTKIGLPRFNPTSPFFL